MPATIGAGSSAARSRSARHGDEPGERDRDEHELEVRDRARALDPRVVDHRVAGDQRGDAEPESEPARVRGRAAADEQDAGRNDRDAHRLGRARDVAERERGEQHEHRRSAARDRVDERQVGARVRRREREEVDELERRRGGDVGQGGGVDVPGQRGEGRRDDDRGGDGDGGCRAGVARAGDDEVPGGVQEGGAERQSERCRAQTKSDAYRSTGTPFGSFSCA